MRAIQKAYNIRAHKLNKIEEMKKIRTPEEAYSKLEQYAKDGYASIPVEDKKYFLKCYGIYDRPATPERFMIKMRIPGGHLNSEQARVIGECSSDYGQDYIDLTTRAQCEIRYLKIEDLPTLVKRMESVGLNAYQTGVDNIRGIVADPFDDLAFDNVVPSHKTLLKLQDVFLKNPDWISTLPRKFNTSISGNLSNRCNVYGNDCCFVAAQKNGMFGYNLYLGGRVGIIATNANIFLKDAHEVIAAFTAIIELFKQFGFRDNRNKNRLHFLIQAVGMEEFTKEIRQTAGIEFASAGETMTKMDYVEPDHGKIQLRDGTMGVHVVVPSGIFKGSALVEAADLADKYGNGNLRFDLEQSFYIMGVTDSEKLLKESYFQTYKNVDTPYKNHLIACAGTEHCPFGVIENKNDAIHMADYLALKVPLESCRVRMYWSACVKGCGIHGLGDIGFEGCKAKIDGINGSGVHIFLGGKLSGESAEGHTVIKSAPLEYAKLYVESLMLEYKRLRNDGEEFESFQQRVLTNYTRAKVGFLMMLQAYLRAKDIDIPSGFNIKVLTGKNEEFEVFELGRKLYYAITKTEPYTSYTHFSPTNKREKLKDIRKLSPEVDEVLARMIEYMLHPNDRLRAVVFSEITPYILLYNIAKSSD